MAVESIPQVSLDSILFTHELDDRPFRQPDHKKESRALIALTQSLAESPQTILQALADTILEVLECGSAGVSLLTPHDGGKRFYWPAISGVWKQHTSALVRVASASGKVTLEVRDNGRGIGPEVQAAIASGKTPGVGLRGMRERVMAIGGEFTIESNGSGTSVLLTLPLAQGAAAQA